MPLKNQTHIIKGTLQRAVQLIFKWHNIFTEFLLSTPAFPLLRDSPRYNMESISKLLLHTPPENMEHTARFSQFVSAFFPGQILLRQIPRKFFLLLTQILKLDSFATFPSIRSSSLLYPYLLPVIFYFLRQFLKKRQITFLCSFNDLRSIFFIISVRSFISPV